MSVAKVMKAIYRADKLPLEDRLWAVAEVRVLAAKRRQEQRTVLDSDVKMAEKQLARRRVEVIDACMDIINAIDLSK